MLMCFLKQVHLFKARLFCLCPLPPPPSRLPCDERCTKLLLPCGHRCPGLCGEECPPAKFCVEPACKAKAPHSVRDMVGGRGECSESDTQQDLSRHLGKADRECEGAGL